MHLPFVFFVVVYMSVINHVIAQDIKAVKKNWSSEESESAEDAKATPAPIIKVNPPPPIKPATISLTPQDIKLPMTKDIKLPSMTKDIKPVISTWDKPQIDPFPSTSDSFETFESFESESLEEIKVKEGSIFVDPKPLTKEEVGDLQSSGSRAKNKASPAAAAQRGAPIKVPFIPKSGPKVEVGTVLKPGGFNGRKPVQRPRQVKSLPYESWAESPLSMAPKPPKMSTTTAAP